MTTAKPATSSQAGKKDWDEEDAATNKFGCPFCPCFQLALYAIAFTLIGFSVYLIVEGFSGKRRCITELEMCLQDCRYIRTDEECARFCGIQVTDDTNCVLDQQDIYLETVLLGFSLLFSTLILAFVMLYVWGFGWVGTWFGIPPRRHYSSMEDDAVQMSSTPNSMKLI